MAPRSRFKWKNALKEASSAGFETAHNYESFTGCFPAWHRDVARAEILGPQILRFIWDDSLMSRRVTAFQQGFCSEIIQKKSAIPSSPVPDNPETRDRLGRVFESCRRNGHLGFSYTEPIDFYQFLQLYSNRVSTVFRRDDSLDLDGFTIGTFKAFYIALLTICATREILCYWWGNKNSRYPLNSAVIVKKKTEWISLLSRLTSLSNEVVATMLGNLIFPTQKPRRPVDLIVHPFVPLDADTRLLGLVPHLPLYSRPDENILRMTSHLNPVAYNTSSQSKEEEMRHDLISDLPPHISTAGPVILPDGNPDLDLILEDKASSTLVLAELKWTRKPISLFERCDRDEDFIKGIAQLRNIKKFLSQNPSYLTDRGKTSRSLTEYSEVRYILIARDHFVWVDPDEAFPVIDHEIFKNTLSKEKSLFRALNVLLSFDWLPVEGRDFTVRFERAIVNRVSIDSEVFHAPSEALR